MATIENKNTYVKFVRGTRKAWDSLSKKQEDTLYFIYETKDSSTGVLYLGDKQIGGTGGTVNIPASLRDLQDLNLDSVIPNGNILVYDASSSKWINSSIDELVNVNELINFNDLIFEIDQNNIVSLAGFSTAEVGQIPTISSTGKLAWTAVGELSDISNLKQDISDLKENSITETKVAEMIAGANHLQYKIVESLESIQSGQIQNPSSYIYLVPTENLTGSNLYDEYMFIENKLEQVGKWDINLADYVTKSELTTVLTNFVAVETFTELETKVSSLENVIDQSLTKINNFIDGVGDLNSLITYEEDYTLVQQVNELSERLTWQEILE